MRDERIEPALLDKRVSFVLNYVFVILMVSLDAFVRDSRDPASVLPGGLPGCLPAGLRLSLAVLLTRTVQLKIPSTQPTRRGAIAVFLESYLEIGLLFIIVFLRKNSQRREQAMCEAALIVCAVLVHAADDLHTTRFSSNVPRSTRFSSNDLHTTRFSSNDLHTTRFESNVPRSTQSESYVNRMNGLTTKCLIVTNLSAVLAAMRRAGDVLEQQTTHGYAFYDSKTIPLLAAAGGAGLASSLYLVYVERAVRRDQSGPSRFVTMQAFVLQSTALLAFFEQAGDEDIELFALYADHACLSCPASRASRTFANLPKVHIAAIGLSAVAAANVVRTTVCLKSREEMYNARRTTYVGTVLLASFALLFFAYNNQNPNTWITFGLVASFSSALFLNVDFGTLAFATISIVSLWTNWPFGANADSWSAVFLVVNASLLTLISTLTFVSDLLFYYVPTTIVRNLDNALGICLLFLGVASVVRVAQRAFHHALFDGSFIPNETPNVIEYLHAFFGLVLTFLRCESQTIFW